MSNYIYYIHTIISNAIFKYIFSSKRIEKKRLNIQCTVFRKAYILSGSGFHEFLYSIIESLKKNCEIADFIPNQLRFHEKNFS